MERMKEKRLIKSEQIAPTKQLARAYGRKSETIKKEGVIRRYRDKFKGYVARVNSSIDVAANMAFKEVIKNNPGSEVSREALRYEVIKSTFKSMGGSIFGGVTWLAALGGLEYSYVINAISSPSIINILEAGAPVLAIGYTMDYLFSEMRAIWHAPVVIQAKSTVKEIMRYYSQMTGENFPVPKFGLGYGNYFDPAESVFSFLGLRSIHIRVDADKYVFAHETAHYFRHKVVGSPLPYTSTKEKEAMEEGCAIFAAEAFLSKGRKSLLLSRLQKVGFNPSIPDTALVVIDEYNELENKDDIYPNQISPKQRLSNIQNAIRLTDKKTNTELIDYNSNRSKYWVGAGLALILFVANDLDIKKTMKQILTSKLDELQYSIATVLSQDGKRIRNEIAKMV